MILRMLRTYWSQTNVFINGMIFGSSLELSYLVWDDARMAIPALVIAIGSLMGEIFLRNTKNPRIIL
jgi:uncharacterized membrane protein